MNRQSWTSEEDSAISALVDEFGIDDWTKIASKLKERYSIIKRTGKQCRQRWYNHLNPSVNKLPWSNHQETLLFQLHKEYGNRWKQLSRNFTGRTDNDIKNHFYSTLRRSLRRLNKILGEKNSTSQMRQIKPSVLSTIMNFIYGQRHSFESRLMDSLRDLPSLIFEFANFKPVKTNLRTAKIESVREKITEIFSLIGTFNDQYQQSKKVKHLTKSHRKSHLAQQLISKAEQIKEEERPKDTQGSHHFEEENQEENIHQFFKQTHHSTGIFDHKCQEDNQKLFAEYCPKQQIQMKRNISLELDDDLEEQMMMESMEQPSVIMEGLDLIVVGRHWEPKAWQTEGENRDFVEEVLQINYNLNYN